MAIVDTLNFHVDQDNRGAECGTRIPLAETMRVRKGILLLTGFTMYRKLQHKYHVHIQNEIKNCNYFCLCVGR